MMDIVITVSVTVFYCVAGCGVSALVRIGNVNLPKPASIVWPMILVLAAAGVYDKEG